MFNNDETRLITDGLVALFKIEGISIKVTDICESSEGYTFHVEDSRGRTASHFMSNYDLCNHMYRDFIMLVVKEIRKKLTTTYDAMSFLYLSAGYEVAP